MSTIQSSELFAPVFNDDLLAIINHLYTEYVEYGGRASTKSSFISLAIVVLIENNPRFNALIVRKVADTLSESVYEQMLWALDKLHVTNKYKTTTSPLRITNKATGQRIIFRGADRPEKIKSIKLKVGYIAITWLEEVTEFTPRDVMTIKLSTMRGGSLFWIFYSYNPPAAVRNWCNVDLRKPREGRLIHHTSYLDIPRDWLGEAFIAEAEELKKNNERAYRNIFLGEATGTGRTVFENVKAEAISDNQIQELMDKYGADCGIDWGYYPDPYAFNISSYDSRNKTLYIYGELELYKASNERAFEKTNLYMEGYGLSIYTDRTNADSAEPKSIADFREWGGNTRGVNKGRLGSDKNRGATSREASFKWLQSLANIIIDPVRAPKTLDEFSLYEYDLDKKTGEIMEGYPDGQKDHHIDAVRYENEPHWRRAGV